MSSILVGKPISMQHREMMSQSSGSASPAADLVAAASSEEGSPATNQSDAPTIPSHMVIIKFISRHTKSRVMSSRKALKNMNRGIYSRSANFHDDPIAKMQSWPNRLAGWKNQAR